MAYIQPACLFVDEKQKITSRKKDAEKSKEVRLEKKKKNGYRSYLILSYPVSSSHHYFLLYSHVPNPTTSHFTSNASSRWIESKPKMKPTAQKSDARWFGTRSIPFLACTAETIALLAIGWLIGDDCAAIAVVDICSLSDDILVFG